MESINPQLSFPSPSSALVQPLVHHSHPPGSVTLGRLSRPSRHPSSWPVVSITHTPSCRLLSQIPQRQCLLTSHPLQTPAQTNPSSTGPQTSLPGPPPSNSRCPGTTLLLSEVWSLDWQLLNPGKVVQRPRGSMANLLNQNLPINKMFR